MGGAQSQALQGDRKLAPTGTLCEDRASRLGFACLDHPLDRGVLPACGDRSRVAHDCSDENAVSAIGRPDRAATW